MKPDVLEDAHDLPFADASFDAVVCDPPYSDAESRDMYGTGPLRQAEWMREAVRVAKPGGYVVTTTAAQHWRHGDLDGFALVAWRKSHEWLVARRASGVLEHSGGTYGVEVHDVLANDEHIVALLHAAAEQ